MSLPRIFVVFHSFGTCPTQFVVDMGKALRYSGTIIPAVIHEQSCYVDSARNKLVKQFLSIPDATHMMMVDVDISFESDAFMKTFTVLQTMQADLVYGNYALGNGANSIFGPPNNAAEEAAVRVNLKPNAVYQDIATGGTGWLMCTRQLLERMEKECPGPWHWFARDLTTDGKDLRGEDISFGLRAWKLNPQPRILGITNVTLRHLKNQGFYANFMSGAIRPGEGAGITIPNPFESDPKRYHVFGNSVIDKDGLTPEQRAAVEDAERTGRPLEAPSYTKGPEGQAGERVRVRDDAKDGLETKEGNPTDGSSNQEEVKNGRKRNRVSRKSTKTPGAADRPTTKGKASRSVEREKQSSKGEVNG